MTHRPLQPLLHDLVSTTLAPTSTLSDQTGQIRSGAGVQGVFHADARVLSRAELRLDGREPESIAHADDGPHGARFVSLARWLGDPQPDPTVRIDRIRRLVPQGMAEEIQLVSTASVPVRTTVTVDLDCDLAPIEVVKSGGATTSLEPKSGGPGQVLWTAEGTTVTATGEGADTPAQPDPAAGARLCWTVDLGPRERATLHWRLAVDDPRAVVVAPPREPAWSRPVVEAHDHRLVRLLDRSLDDLRALRLAEAAAPHEVFLGAGVPWFLTLFGRDSL
ncbi:MAG TPA: glycogen debranching N-terminal domain-containing protein, partial [Micromonospora sp.]